jgi:dTDP-4-dehydrorhamnose 3,5-epimerase
LFYPQEVKVSDSVVAKKETILFALFDGINPTLFNLAVHKDNRGSFTELWKHGINTFDALQSNLSVNTKAGTFRGLHFQTFVPQAKLVTPIMGGIVDYIVDVRYKSKTFGKYAAFELQPGQSLLVPKGFAHGFLTTRDNTVINYLVDGGRFAEYERSINVLDEEIVNAENDKIHLLQDIYQKVSDLGLSLSDLVISDKDKYAPSFGDLVETRLNEFTHYIGADLC